MSDMAERIFRSLKENKPLTGEKLHHRIAAGSGELMGSALRIIGDIANATPLKDTKDAFIGGLLAGLDKEKTPPIESIQPNKSEQPVTSPIATGC